MTTLYRSPDVIIDRHEWHLIVKRHNGRTFKRFFWRPLSLKTLAWSNVAAWRGPKPKGLGDRFTKFKTHVAAAMECEARRRDAAMRLRGPETAASAANRQHYVLPAAAAHTSIDLHNQFDRAH